MKAFLTFSGALLALLLSAQPVKVKDNIGLAGGVLVGNKFVYATGSGQLGYSNGSAAGTQMIDPAKVVFDFSNMGMALMGGKLYFVGNNTANGSELWVTDGTDAGTQLVKDIGPGAAGGGIQAPNKRSNFAVVNGLLYFVANDGVTGAQLWKTNGSAAGTSMVKRINQSGSTTIIFPDMLDSNFAVGSNFFFIADDGIHGQELWRTDGTDAGTAIVADIKPGIASTDFMSGFFALCGTLMFVANDGIHGYELWRTDGTAPGTFLLKDIVAGSRSAFNANQDELPIITFMNKLYFMAFEGGAESYQNEQMWVTDGTTTNTKAVTNFQNQSGGFHARLTNESNAVIRGGKFYFVVFDANSISSSLWRSDGTTAGTQMVVPLNATVPDYGNGYRYPIARILLPQNGANEDNVSQQLFAGNQFFMWADDGVHGAQLWISDGSAAGTRMLLINSAGAGIDTSSYLDNVSWYFGDQYFYFTGRTAAEGAELWRSDGSQAGTQRLSDIKPGTEDAGIRIYGVVDGTKLLLTAFDGAALNLYRVDGVRPLLDAAPTNLCPGGSVVLPSDVSGTTYQWQVNTGAGFVALADDQYHQGATGAALSLQGVPSSFYGYQYRCVVDGGGTSRTYTLRFVAFWLGLQNGNWDNAANWRCGAVPDANTDVLIQCSRHTPVITADTSCRTLWLLYGQTIQVAAGKQLTITLPSQ